MRRKEGRGSKRVKESKDKEGEGEEFDIKKLKGFMNKTIDFTRKNYIVLLLLLLLGLTLYIRFLPPKLLIADSWAKKSVYSYIKNDLTRRINQQYPNLPPQQKQQMIEDSFKQLINDPQQKSVIEQQIKQGADYLRSQFQYSFNNRTYTFLGDLDSYHWLRYARNLVEKGSYCDEIIDGKCFDNHMIAPLGVFIKPNLHPYLIYLSYKINNAFRRFDLQQSSYLVPVLLSLVVVIVAFFIGYRVSGVVGGFFSALILTVNPFFIRRTVGSDNDIYNIMFPLLIIWAFIEAFEAESNKKRVFYSLLAGFFVGLFSFAWNGWWFIYDILLGAMGIYVLYLIVMGVINNSNSKSNNKNMWKVIFSPGLKNALFIILLFIVSSGVFYGLFNGFNLSGFIKAPIMPLAMRSLKSAVKGNLWPNIYTTVAELNPGSWADIYSNVGGSFSFLVSVFGIIGLMFFKRDKQGNFDIKLSLILVLWFLASTYASLKGVRFIILIIPAFAIAFGSALGFIYKLIVENSDWLGIDKKVISGIVIVLLLVASVKPVQAGINSAKTYIPNINKTWYESLTKIRNYSNKNAIINSWWDFGHWFKYFADRRVTLDGASQNAPQAYWLGRILVTDDEEEAVSILRMLDCGSNKAFEVIDKKKNDTRLSVNLVKKIIRLNKDDAVKVLRDNGFNEEEINEIMNYTHCEPPEDYFITSDDMIGKSGVWAHFGLWNFEKAEILVKVGSLSREDAIDFMMKELNYTRERAESTYNEVVTLSSTRERENWISKWPGYASGTAECSVTNKTMIECINKLGNGYLKTIIDYSDLDVDIVTSMGLKKPSSIVVYDHGIMRDRDFKESDLDLSIVLIIDDNKVLSFYCSKELAKSLFTRLYFGNAAGLKHFKLFGDFKNKAVGTRVVVWNVSWEGINNVIEENNSRVVVDYIGYLENGSVFDSSILNWKEYNITKDSDFNYPLRRPLSFTTGSNQVIPGFEKGLIGLKQGDEKLIVVKPNEGYKNGDLANKTLYFKVRVLSVN